MSRFGTTGDISFTFDGAGISVSDSRPRDRWFKILSGTNPYAAQEVTINETDGSEVDGEYTLGTSEEQLWELTGATDVAADTYVRGFANPFGSGFVFLSAEAAAGAWSPVLASKTVTGLVGSSVGTPATSGIQYLGDGLKGFHNSTVYFDTVDATAVYTGGPFAATATIAETSSTSPTTTTVPPLVQRIGANSFGSSSRAPFEYTSYTAPGSGAAGYQLVVGLGLGGYLLGYFQAPGYVVEGQYATTGTLFTLNGIKPAFSVIQGTTSGLGLGLGTAWLGGYGIGSGGDTFAGGLWIRPGIPPPISPPPVSPPGVPPTTVPPPPTTVPPPISPPPPPPPPGEEWETELIGPPKLVSPPPALPTVGRLVGNAKTRYDLWRMAGEPVIYSPDGTAWKVSVNNLGILTTTVVTL